MRKLRSRSDDNLDAILSGNGPNAGREDDVLAAFVDQLKRAAEMRPAPSVEDSHVAAMVETAQLFVEKGEPVARPASKAAGSDYQASRLPKRRRKFVLSSLFASLTAKLAAGGVAVAMAATGGLAAAGELPDQIQDTVAMAADNVGIDLPTSDDDLDDVTDDLDDVTDDLDDVVDDGTDTGEEAGEDDVTKSGKSSSADVHAAINATEPGPERGKAVSEAARQKPAGGTDTQADGTTKGSATSAAVHEAINSTEPGPERGKAVSQAASGKVQGGGVDTDGGTDDDDNDDSGTAQTASQAAKGKK